MARKPRKALGTVLAEANAVAPAEKPKRKRRASTEAWPCTAEQIKEERDLKGYSWRQVAKNLGLDNPGQARKAYTELTGIHHSDSNPVTNRAPKGSMTRGGRAVTNPKWDDESDQDEILERLEDATITVRRERYGFTFDEDVIVFRVVEIFYDGKDETGPLAVTVAQQVGERPKSRRGVPVRTFRVSDIVAVR